MCLYVVSSVLWCPWRLQHKNFVRLYLQLFAGGLMSYLRYLCLLAHIGIKHILSCFCFACVCLVYPMLSVSLDCPFLIAYSVFSNVYWYLICRLKIHVKQRMSVYKISSKKSWEIVNKTTLVEESTCNCYIWQIYVASCVNYTVWP